MTDRTAMIRQHLEAALSPVDIAIEDQSALHAGHAGAQSGGGHFTVRIISDQFAGKTRIERHRMVYKALANIMHTEIHALSILPLTPEERDAG